MDDTIRFPQIIDEQPRCEYRYEIELGMIIGSAIDEPTKEGIKHILGYTVFNDGCLRGQRPSYVTFDWTGSKRSEEHTSELQSLMRISYAVFCLKKKTTIQQKNEEDLIHTS